MAAWRSWSRLARSCRRPAVGVVALAYLATALGLPVPASFAKDTSRPFPCQGHACGCLSAQQCFEHCCCFTPAQQRTWALAHNVEPPAASGWDSRPKRQSKAACRSCAKAQPASRACCSQTKLPVKPTCALGPMRCRGASTLWVLTGVAPPPPTVSAIEDHSPPDWAMPATVYLHSQARAPESPPPRAVLPF